MQPRRSMSQFWRATFAMIIGFALTFISVIALLHKTDAQSNGWGLFGREEKHGSESYSSPARRWFGVVQAEREYVHSTRQAGVNLRTIGIAWSQFEPREGVAEPDYISVKLQEFAQARAAGYDVVLDLGLQYPPDWIWSYPHSLYVNQWGAEYRSTDSGGNGVNAVFNNEMRIRQARYVQQVFGMFGTEFIAVRLGWGYYAFF